MKHVVRNSITEDMDEFGKVGAEMPNLQSKMDSDYDSAESIADSDLEDGELRKMLASPLYLQIKKTMNPLECQSHRGYLLHYFRREEQVQSVLKLI